MSCEISEYIPVECSQQSGKQTDDNVLIIPSLPINMSFLLHCIEDFSHLLDILSRKTGQQTRDLVKVSLERGYFVLWRYHFEVVGC